MCSCPGVHHSKMSSVMRTFTGREVLLRRRTHHQTSSTVRAAPSLYALGAGEAGARRGDEVTARSLGLSKMRLARHASSERQTQRELSKERETETERERERETKEKEQEKEGARSR